MLVLLNFDIANSNVSDSLFMTVGDKPITKSDIVDEIKILLILNNESYSNEKIEKLHELAVKSTVKRTVKEIELERNNYYQFNNEDLQNELNRLASNIFMDLDTLKNICSSNELNFEKIENQVKVELYWNSLIFQLYKNRLVINPDQIEERIKIVQQEKKLNEFLISEIIIKHDETREIAVEVEELKNKINTYGFEETAREISISESSIKGGDLGWLNENILSDKIKSLIVNTPVGSITEHIELSEGIIIFKLRDKREVEQNLSIEEIKNQIVQSEKSKILRMHSLSHYDKVLRSISIKLF